LSSVVAQELHAGAIDPSSASHLDRFFENFESLGRVVTPTRQDWLECGRVLSKIGKKFGFESVRRSRLVNDVLIALSCHQIEAALLTANVGDFRMISEFVDFEMAASD
jgi:predicted nucleic acid-binding protein